MTFDNRSLTSDAMMILIEEDHSNNEEEDVAEAPMVVHQQHVWGSGSHVGKRPNMERHQVLYSHLLYQDFWGNSPVCTVYNSVYVLIIANGSYNEASLMSSSTLKSDWPPAPLPLARSASNENRLVDFLVVKVIHARGSLLVLVLLQRNENKQNGNNNLERRTTQQPIDHQIYYPCYDQKFGRASCPTLEFSVVGN